MKYIEGFNRSQTLLFPQCIDEIIPLDAEVRIIEAFVESLPLKELGSNKKKDTFTCPMGQTLKSNGQWYNRKYDEYITRIKHYKTPKCKTCPALTKCTSNAMGRILERSEYAEAAERNMKRVRRQPSIYSARQQLIEHVFGTIKRQWGYDHILLKGLRKNDGEFGLIYLVYNFSNRVITEKYNVTCLCVTNR